MTDQSPGDRGVTLQRGSRLGPYEVVSLLGAGGMGEVYRARDSRLGREVAIKVLPAELASDRERLKRFEKEARSASALNHPNIVTIHDIGLADSVSYIAMELVEGDTLRKLLDRGALSIKKLLSIATQVADGLAMAHEAGIVHRDLKPENVMVGKDGRVRILDFGLAKSRERPAGKDATSTPTETATGAGTVLGTVGYMSPEQAEGKAIDYRSDQFSFGSILYEMATGRRAFHGKSAIDTLAAILNEEPEPIEAINPKIPAPLRWIIDRCLAKEARRRFASTDDLASDLAAVRDHLSEATSAISLSPEVPTSRGRRWWIPAVTGAAAVLLVFGIVGWRLRQRDYFWRNPLAGAHFSRFTDWEGSELDAAVSSDGKFVAFMSDRDGPIDAFVSQVGSGEFLNLSKGRFLEPFVEGVRNVGFSDDDAHVWIRVLRDPRRGRNSDAWLVPTMGGTPRPFLPHAVQVVWSPDRTRTLFHTADPGDPIFVADRKGANPKQIFIEKPGLHNHYTTWSPDGRFVYFVRGIPPPTWDMDLWRIPSAGGAAERLTNYHARVGYPTFLDGQTLLYTAPRPDGAGSGVYAMDIERRIPHPVSFGLEEYLSVAASTDGRRLVTTVANPTRNLWTVSISDHAADESAASRYRIPAVRAAAPRFGPDYLLYLSSKSGADGLWKFKDGAVTELWNESDGVVAAAPAISPDGSQICFAVRKEGQARLYLMASDGTSAHRIAEALDIRDAPSWSPDDKWIAVAANEGKAQPLFRVPVDGGAPVRLVDGINFNPVWSPDGRFIAYAESQGGTMLQLKAVTPDKQPFPLPDVWYPADGNRHRFLPDGKGLVLMQGQRRQQNFWLLDLASGRLRQLTDLKAGFDTRTFDVSPDGKQILFERFRENSDVVLIDLPAR